MLDKMNLSQSIDKYFFNRFSIIIWLFIVELTLFWKSFIGLQYTGWDTHDAYFTEFILLSDSIRDGYLPIINQFIQSGSFIPALGRTWLYSIFNMPFVVLSFFINPLIAFELLLHFYAIVAALGFYLFINILTQNRAISIFGSTAFLMALTHPMLGQLGYLLSLSILPWLLYYFHYMLSYKINIYKGIILILLFGIFITGCDPWHLVVGYVIALTYALIYILLNDIDKTFIYKFILFLFFTTLVYLLINVEGIINLYDSYSWDNGIYVSPEPRLRSIGLSEPNLLLGNVFHSIIASIDATLLSPITDKTGWYRGTGLVVFVVLIFTIFSKKINQISYLH